MIYPEERKKDFSNRLIPKTIAMDPIHILMVEDNEGDIMLTTEALEETNILSHLSVAKNGKEALDFLNNAGKYSDAVMPDLMLLDVNMPKMNGYEVLKYVKENEKLKHIPVIVFTTSSSQKDVNKAYQNHANCFITKPVDGEDFTRVVAAIENFWISIVKLTTSQSNVHEQR